MFELLTAADVERLAVGTGLTIKEVCDRAGVAQTTFWRWRTGKTSPSIDVYRRLLSAARGEPAKDAAE